MKHIYCLIAVLIIHMVKVKMSCKNFSNLSHDAQLIWLMNNESDDIIYAFSIYINGCFNLRDDFIYVLLNHQRFSTHSGQLSAGFLCICLISSVLLTYANVFCLLYLFIY